MDRNSYMLAIHYGLFAFLAVSLLSVELRAQTEPSPSQPSDDTLAEQREDEVILPSGWLDEVDVEALPWIAASPGPCDLSLGLRRSEDESRLDWLGFLEFKLPFEGCARQSSAREAEAPARAVADPKIAEPLVASDRSSESDELSISDEAPAPASAHRAEPEPSLLAWKRLFGRFYWIGLEHQGFERDLLELRAAGTRARQSGLLPELRVRGQLGLDQSVAEQSQSATWSEVTTRGTAGSVFEARLTFRLARLVFDDAEPGLLRQQRDVVSERRKWTKEVHQLFETFRVGLISSHDVALSEAARRRFRREADGALLLLDQESGGRFFALLQADSELYRYFQDNPPESEQVLGSAEGLDFRSALSILRQNEPIGVAGADPVNALGHVRRDQEHSERPPKAR